MYRARNTWAWKLDGVEPRNGGMDAIESAARYAAGIACALA